MAMFSRRVSSASSRKRFLLLSASLLCLISALPFFSDNAAGMMALLALSSTVLMLAVYAVSDTHSGLVVGLVLGVPTLVFSWLSLMVGGFAVDVLCFSFGTLFHGYVTVKILLHVLQQRRITEDTLSAAVVVYLMMGVAWAWAYNLVDVVLPGSFQSAGALADGTLPWHELLYFSYVALTTLGFGDINPVSRVARSLAILQGISGVLYVAVLVARLVGMYISQRIEGDANGSRASGDS